MLEVNQHKQAEYQRQQAANDARDDAMHREARENEARVLREAQSRQREEDSLPVVAIRDHPTKVLFSHAVPFKGSPKSGSLPSAIQGSPTLCRSWCSTAAKCPTARS